MGTTATAATNDPRGLHDPPRMLRVTEVAERLGVSKFKVYDLINTSGLPAYQLGGKHHVFRIKEDEFEAWLYGDGDGAA